jgi:hypothetical protein
MTIDLDTISAFLTTAKIGFDDDAGNITLEDSDGNALRIYWDASMPDNRGWAYTGPGGGGAIDEDSDILDALRDGLGRSFPALDDVIDIYGEDHTVSGPRDNPRLTGPGGEVLHITLAGRAGLLMAEDPHLFLRRAATDRRLGQWRD